MKRFHPSRPAPLQPADAVLLPVPGPSTPGDALLQQARQPALQAPVRPIKATRDDVRSVVLSCSIRLARLLREQCRGEQQVRSNRTAASADTQHSHEAVRQRQLRLNLAMGQAATEPLSPQIRSHAKAAVLASQCTLEGLALPSTCALLANPCPDVLQVARQEVLWLIVRRGDHPQQVRSLISLLRYLLVMQPDLPFVLDVCTIPSGESGRQLLNQLSLAFAGAGKLAPPFVIRGALPPDVDPLCLPMPLHPSRLLDGSLPAPLLRHPALAQQVRTCAQALGQALVDLQKIGVQAQQRQQTQLLAQTVLAEQLPDACCALGDALDIHRQTCLPDPSGGMSAEQERAMLHAETVFLAMELIAAGMELPHTLEALLHSPPQAAPLQAARTEVLDRVVETSPAEPRLIQLLGQLFQLAPRQAFRVTSSAQYKSEDDPDSDWLSERMQVLTEIARAIGPLHSLTIEYHRSSSEQHVYEPSAVALFREPVCLDLKICGIALYDAELLAIIEAQHARPSSLQALDWDDLPKDMLLNPLFGQALMSLGQLQSLALGMAEEEVEAQDDLSGLAQVLIAIPVKCMHLYLQAGYYMDGAAMAPYVQAIVDSAQASGSSPRWQQAKLSWADTFDLSPMLIHQWVRLLVASPATDQISLLLDDNSEDRPARLPAAVALETQRLLRQREAPLAVNLYAEDPVAVDILVDVFVPLPYKWSQLWPEPAETAGPNCLHSMSIVVARDNPLYGEFSTGKVMPSGPMDMLLAWVITRRPELQRLGFGLTRANPGCRQPLFFSLVPPDSTLELFVPDHPGVSASFGQTLQHQASMSWLDHAASRAFMSVVGQASLPPNRADTSDVADKLVPYLDRGWPSRVLPLINRSHLLKAVDEYNLLSRSARTSGSADMVNLLPPHPLEGSAELVRQHLKKPARRRAGTGD